MFRNKSKNLTEMFNFTPHGSTRSEKYPSVWHRFSHETHHPVSTDNQSQRWQAMSHTSRHKRPNESHRVQARQTDISRGGDT